MTGARPVTLAVIPIDPMNVNRKDRDRASCLIRKALNRQLTAAEFEEAVEEFGRSTDDTVNKVCLELYSFGDQLSGKYLSLNKPSWNYIQRLLLLLDSDMHWTETSRFSYSYVQIFAGMGVLVFAIAFAVWGWSPQLWASIVVLGIYSLTLNRFRKPINHPQANIGILYPFHDLRTLEHAYQSTTTFVKQKYPDGIFRDHVDKTFWHSITNCVATLMASPIVLLIQAFPRRYPITRVTAG